MDFLPPDFSSKKGRETYYARVGRARYLLRTEPARRAREERREAKRLAKEEASRLWHERRAAALEARIKAVRDAADEIEAKSILSRDQRIRLGLEQIAKAEILEAERAARKIASAEREKERQRLYRIANRDRNLELQRQWREANKDKARAHKKARRRAKRTKVKVALLKVQKGRCAYCRAKLQPADMHVDHIHPLSKGGSSDLSNLQLTCSGCNLRKNAKDPVAFAQELGRLV